MKQAYRNTLGNRDVCKAFLVVSGLCAEVNEAYWVAAALGIRSEVRLWCMVPYYNRSVHKHVP